MDLNSNSLESKEKPYAALKPKTISDSLVLGMDILAIAMPLLRHVEASNSTLHTIENISMNVPYLEIQFPPK